MITEFNIESETIRVTDPCYDKDTWCAGTIANCATGKWTAETLHTKDEWFGGSSDRNAELIIYHESVQAPFWLNPNWIKTDIHVGVDSGQAGFFDEKYYPEKEQNGEYGDLDSFYGKICHGTQGEVKTRKRPVDEERLESLTKILLESGVSEEEINDKIKILREFEEDRVDHYHDYLGIANVGFGVACSSGYGDGGYDCYTVTENGKVVAAKIIFIGDEDEDYEDEEDAN